METEAETGGAPTRQRHRGGHRREPGERPGMAAVIACRTGRPDRALASRAERGSVSTVPSHHARGGLSRQPHTPQAGCQGGAGPGHRMFMGAWGEQPAEPPTGAFAVIVPVDVRKGSRGNLEGPCRRPSRSGSAFPVTASAQGDCH